MRIAMNFYFKEMYLMYDQNECVSLRAIANNDKCSASSVTTSLIFQLELHSI